MTTTKTPAEILREAAAVIERNGWCQDDYYDWVQKQAESKPPAECRVCAVGAINLAATGEPRDVRPDEGVTGALNVLATSLNIHCIPDWNDAPGRTVTEVLDALHRAAQLAEGGA
jgi:hypothetical protein